MNYITTTKSSSQHKVCEGRNKRVHTEFQQKLQAKSYTKTKKKLKKGNNS